jgi:hypothetical protein
MNRDDVRDLVAAAIRELGSGERGRADAIWLCR